MTAWQPDAHNGRPDELNSPAPLICSVLDRLHGRSVLVVNAAEIPVTNGRVVLTPPAEGSLLPGLAVEFTLRGLIFLVQLPRGRAFALMATWTGSHFVFRLSRDRLRVQEA
jgi:hypothetical protein